MRRETLIAASKRINDDLQTSGIEQMLETAVEKFHQATAQKRDDSLGISLDVFQKYSVATSTYGPAEIEMAKILDIYPLFSPDAWQKMATAQDPGLIYSFRHRVNFTKQYLPRIIKLLEQDYVTEAKSGGQLPRELEGRTAITFILPEDKHEYSTPGRLVAALEAITSIYSVHCTLEEMPESDLIVLACDSGSDKSFDFLGLAKIMEEVRKFVIAIWDRRVFHRHMHASQCIALIAQSLPVVEKIESMKQSGVLPPEQAELLKRRTLQGATMFLESGIYIDEMAIEANHSPRQLMRPEPKLLAAPLTAAQSTEKTMHEAAKLPTLQPRGELSAEEAAVLEHLLAKARTEAEQPKNSPKKAARPTKRRDGPSQEGNRK